MKERKYLVLGITLVLLTFVGVSLAYFLTTIEGDRKNITINTSDLRVIFTNGDAIEGTEIEPGWSVTKTFSVENKTKNEYKYNIVIEDLVNTFVTEGYLQYKITSTDGGYNMDDFKDVPKSPNAIDVILAYNVSIPSKSIQNYTITIQYRNDEEEDQSIDSLLDAIVTGNIFITEGTIKPALAEVILRDNPTIEERTDFSVTNEANTTGTIYQTDKTEDGSTVYYYSGNTTNNWVKFGKYQKDFVKYRGYYSATTSTDFKEYNTMDECTSATSFNINCTEQKYASDGDDMYWRIIRTNEDGSLRLLYSGISPDTTKGYIGTSPFNSTVGNPMYVGYMYGTSGSLENNRTNENDSTIKTYIDTWYENNLLNNYDKYISKTAIYCNDRSISSNQSYSISDYFNYGVSTRLRSNKIPTYKCGGDGNGGLFESIQAYADKFSASTDGGGNAQLKYPVALMTADEIAFAGGVNGKAFSSSYAWYYANSQGESITDNYAWYLLSPVVWGGSLSHMFNISNDSAGPGYVNVSPAGSSYGNRPSISIASCVKIKSGDGTPDNPYVVDYENSCN